MGEAAQAAQAAPSAIDEYNAAVLKKHSRKRFKPLIATIVAVAVVAGISAGSYFTYAGVQKSRHAAAVRAASASAAAAQSAAELKKEQWAQTVTKDRADYLETAHDYAEKVYDTYPVLEGIGNEISKEWYDAIYNDPDFSISIDQAIDNAQKKEAYEIAQAKNINDELISDYNILQSPPPDSADFAGLTDDLSNMRDAYGTLYLTVILPAGNYDHYYSNVQNAEKTFVPVYNTLCDTLNNIGN
jgi:uncharacterized protein (UPF0333 family)